MDSDDEDTPLGRLCDSVVGLAPGVRKVIKEFHERLAPTAGRQLEARLAAAFQPGADYSAVAYRLRGVLMQAMLDWHNECDKTPAAHIAFVEAHQGRDLAVLKKLVEDEPYRYCQCRRLTFDALLFGEGHNHVFLLDQAIAHFRPNGAAFYHWFADELVRVVTEGGDRPLFAKEFAAV